MKRWIVVDHKHGGDCFERVLAEGTTREEAIKAARITWEKLSAHDRKRSNVAAALADWDEDEGIYSDPVEWIEISEEA